MVVSVKFFTQKVVFISITAFFVWVPYNTTYGQTTNNILILHPNNACMACIGVSGYNISLIDNKFNKIFIFPQNDDFSIAQLKQKIKNTYSISEPFEAIANDSFYGTLLKRSKISKWSKWSFPLLFYSDGLNPIRYIATADKIPDKIALINSQLKYPIRKSKIKLNLDESLLNSCPNCFINIINDTFLLLSNLSSKINFLNIKYGEKQPIRRNLLSYNNFLPIYMKLNNSDSSNYSMLRTFPVKPIISIASIPVENEMFISALYYSVKRMDSDIIASGPIKYGIIKMNGGYSGDLVLIPLKYKDSSTHQLRLYDFIYLRKDTFIFLFANFNGLSKCNEYFIGKFKRYEDDSIVFIDYIKNIKYGCNGGKNGRILKVPIIRNEWILLEDNNSIFNVISNKQIPFFHKKIFNFYEKSSTYLINPASVYWADFKEAKYFYRLIFFDKTKIFIINISKVDGSILSGQSYPLKDENGKRVSNIILYNESLFYLTSNGYLITWSFN